MGQAELRPTHSESACVFGIVRVPHHDFLLPIDVFYVARYIEERLSIAAIVRVTQKCASGSSSLLTPNKEYFQPRVFLYPCRILSIAFTYPHGRICYWKMLILDLHWNNINLWTCNFGIPYFLATVKMQYCFEFSSPLWYIVKYFGSKK